MSRTETGRPVKPAAPHGVSRIALNSVLAALGGALAVWLIWLGTITHLERACVLSDTPYLPLCSTALPDSEPLRKQDLTRRLRDNPGDSLAWVALANVESGPAHQPLLRAIEALAPREPDSLRLRAQQALALNQMPLATELLVKMTDHRIGGEEPPQILARLLATSEGPALLRPHLIAGSRWLPRVLDKMAALKLPMEPGLELLAEAATKRVATPETVRSFVRSLKAAGKWVDAYGLWMTQQRQPVPTLFNANFEQRFQPDGFDWEPTPVPPSRAGVLFAQRNIPRHGQVLEIEYTGRAVPTPVIRQYLFLAPGRYAVHGRFMTTKLRMEQGLAWAVRCTDGAKSLAGRSDALQDTAGLWQNFQFEFEMAEECGAVASLQLETFAPFEAAAGFRGRASFDSFELRRLDSKPG